MRAMREVSVVLNKTRIGFNKVLYDDATCAGLARGLRSFRKVCSSCVRRVNGLKGWRRKGVGRPQRR